MTTDPERELLELLDRLRAVADDLDDEGDAMDASAGGWADLARTADSTRRDAYEADARRCRNVADAHREAAQRIRDALPTAGT